jgi:hypothetical protein
LDFTHIRWKLLKLKRGIKGDGVKAICVECGKIKKRNKMIEISRADLFKLRGIKAKANFIVFSFYDESLFETIYKKCWKKF